LLIAPLVVSFADSTAVRVVVAGGAAVVLAGAIWYSKRLKAEELVPSARSPAPTPARVTTEAG
jgi:hypothetical protein